VDLVKRKAYHIKDIKVFGLGCGREMVNALKGGLG